MTDPRNIAHDKKVQQEKKHHHEAIAPDAVAKPQPGKKPHLQHHASDELPVETDANGLVVPRP
jgi:hypothetical protein